MDPLSKNVFLVKEHAKLFKAAAWLVWGDIPEPLSLNLHPMAFAAWFGLLDFKVLLLEKPGGAPKAQFTENKGYRWYSQK